MSEVMDWDAAYRNHVFAGPPPWNIGVAQPEIVAVIDALGQCADWQEELEETVIAPLEREAEARHRTIRTRAAATKVEFFTVAREAGT